MENQLSKFTFDEKKLDFLKFEYCCLFYHICEVRGLKELKKDTIDFFRTFKDRDSSVYIYFIYGYLQPLFSQERAEGKVRKGTKEITIEGRPCQFNGELDSDG